NRCRIESARAKNVYDMVRLGEDKLVVLYENKINGRDLKIYHLDASSLVESYDSSNSRIPKLANAIHVVGDTLYVGGTNYQGNVSTQNASLQEWRYENNHLRLIHEKTDFGDIADPAIAGFCSNESGQVFAVG